jgi:hypothetical protein
MGLGTRKKRTTTIKVVKAWASFKLKTLPDEILKI